MPRIAGPLFACTLVLANAPANAQAGATPAIPGNSESSPPSTASEPNGATVQPPTADDVCRALELRRPKRPSRRVLCPGDLAREPFRCEGVSPKGAEGIAQFMPQTASWHGLSNRFDPIEALRHSAAYLRELMNQFGNLGLAEAAYNAGPGRVSTWLTARRTMLCPGVWPPVRVTSTGRWRRTASRWWPLTCRSRPSAMWRSPATSFVGYRAPGSTDRLLG
jgi:hypothetical protein